MLDQLLRLLDAGEAGVMAVLAPPTGRRLLTLRSQAAPFEVLEQEPGTGRPLTVRQPTSGAIAHFQRRPDDCHAAAAATLLQVNYDEIPDARIDERLAAGEDPDDVNASVRAEWEAWLAARGLREVRRPVRPRHGGWLGDIPGDGRFGGHLVVCDGRHVVHDPASNWRCPPGHRVAPPGPTHRAITFEPEDQ